MTATVEYVKQRMGRALTQLRYLPRTLQLVRRSAGRWTAAWMALLLVRGLLPAATVFLTRALVDGVVAVVRSGGTTPERNVLLTAVLMGLVLLAADVLRSVAAYVRTVQAELVQDHIAALIHARSASADLAFYETPDFYDHLYRARVEGASRPLTLLETLGGLLQNGVTLIAMAAVLVQFGAWVPLALFVSTIPALVLVARYAERQHAWQRRRTTDERRTWYYDWLLTDHESAAELRLFGLARQFQAAYSELRTTLRRERIALARHLARAETLAALAALAASGAAMLWMLWRTLHGRNSLGDLALFYQAFYQGLQLMRSLLENVGQLYLNSLFLGNLFEFFELESRIEGQASPAKAAPAGADIRFHQVTFRYPGSRRIALNQFDLHIPPGQIVALVGRNGAGKSTLVKLLCRFYDPDEGRVELGGSDLRTIPLDSVRRQISVLFQKPMRYDETVADNIKLGDLSAAAEDGQIEAAAAAAGADEVIAHLPQAYDTPLGRWYWEGSELSVGEWQRIGMARALFRQASILVLDEPTSAMDPWAEQDWGQRLREFARGKTVILITHRFTTAQFADVIYVMAEGRMVESGTHDELLSRGGLYAGGWNAQARRTTI